MESTQIPTKPEEPIYKKRFVRHSRMMSSQSGRSIRDKEVNNKIDEDNEKLKIEYEIALKKYDDELEEYNNLK